VADQAITPHPAVSFFCFEVPSQATTQVSSFIYLVFLVGLAYLVIPVQPNKQDRQDSPDRSDRPNNGL
jgi:hypothetical protein